MKRFSSFNTGMFLILGTILFAVFLNLCCLKLGYSIEKTKKQTAVLRNENNYISKQIAKYCSPKNIQAYALSAGLKYPEPYSIVILEEVKEKKDKKQMWFANLLRHQRKS